MIIRDISSLYEMPDEAVKWLDRMIDYTVAGGKMNRGLAMMSAYKTLLNSKGTNLTIKVSRHNMIYYFSSPHVFNFFCFQGSLPIRRIGLVHRISAGILPRG